MTTTDRLFSASDLEAIRRATVAAEERTSGEIVPYVVNRCDAYEEAGWKLSALAAMAVAALAGAIHVEGGYWGGFGVLWMTLPVVTAGVLGYLAALWWPGLRRRLVAPEVLEQRVMQRAAAAFLEEEVFATRDRTGVLVFVALFEHRVVVLGDAGINARVEPGDWAGISARLAVGIRRQRAAAALVEAIAEIGALLEEKQVELRPDDFDELSDELRVRHE